ncbi:histidine kinase [Streptosporangium sp. NPDC051022]|uniref:sensor histidine kinase n=1 Tax=Streptosporangium sp. NPDC051022 TaxID=3155752 RepID=UPI003424699B
MHRTDRLVPVGGDSPGRGRDGAATTRRLVTPPRGLEDLLRRGTRLLSPMTLDALLATGLFALTLGPGRIPQDRPEIMALQAALLLPLIWRRRAPFATFCAIAAAAGVQWLADVQLPADLSLLIAVYTVAAHSTWRRTLLAGAVLEGGILLASARWAPEGAFPLSAVALTAMAAVAVATGTNMRTRRAYLVSLKERAVHLERERDQRAQLAIAEERARIARDVHDIVTHNLSVMVALADSAVYVRHLAPDKAADAMLQISGTGRQALADMRRSLGVLRADEPDALLHPMPGIAQLESLAGQMDAAGLPTRLDVEGDPGSVPAAAQLTVYRLAQEALTNALKHTPSGTRAEVRIRLSREAVTMDVTDDGHAAPAAVGAAHDGRAARPSGPCPSGPHPFGPRHFGPRSGHGISGMRERVAAYGGELRAGPLPGGGWRVSARLDLGTALAPDRALDLGTPLDLGTAEEGAA